MKEPISIKEILAIVIRHGKAVIASALVLALILGGVQGMKMLKTYNSPNNTPEMVAQRNTAANAESDAERAMLRDYIETAEHRVEKAREYIQKSLLMQLDPYNKYESHVVLSIGGLDESEYVRAYQDTLGTPVDYVVAKILQQYELYWLKLDINAMVKDHPYEGVEEQYIRELVEVERSQGSTLVITVSSDTAEKASSLCQSVADAILEIQPIIQEGTFTHELVQISAATKQVVDYDLDRDQIIAMEKYDEYQVDLEKYKAELKKVQRPAQEILVTMTDVVKETATWAILGGVVGFVLACGCVWMGYIVRDGVETSRQAEAILKAPYLGSVTGKKDCFHRFADWFVGERSWNDDQTAIAYIMENLKSRMPGKASVALLSTVNVKDGDAGVQRLLEAMQAQGYTVRYAAKAEQNPAAIAALRECEYVVMAERLGTSNRNAMLCVNEQAVQLSGKLLGFVTI